MALQVINTTLGTTQGEDRETPLAPALRSPMLRIHYVITARQVTLKPARKVSNRILKAGIKR